MRCKHVRVLLVDRQPEQLSELESRLLNGHLENCGDCREFQRDIRLLQQGIQVIPNPLLTDDNDRITRQMCYREIETLVAGKEMKRQAQNRARIPRPVYLALMVLIALTLVLIFPVVGEWSFKSQLSLREILTLILVLQNALMLLLSPLLIRRYGRLSGLSRSEIENG